MTAPETKTVSVRLRDNRLTQRYRAGIRVTANQVDVEVDKEQLEALNNDSFIVVSDPVGAVADETDTPEPTDTNVGKSEPEADDEGKDEEPENKDGDVEVDKEPVEIKTPKQTPEEIKKVLLKSNLDGLRKIADEKGVTFKEDDTKAQLADAIIAADAK